MVSVLGSGFVPDFASIDFCRLHSCCKSRQQPFLQDAPVSVHVLAESNLCYREGRVQGHKEQSVKPASKQTANSDLHGGLPTPFKWETVHQTGNRRMKDF